MPNLWGIHIPKNHQNKPITDSFISLGWSALGDLTLIPPNRDDFKRAYKEAYPQEKVGAIPVKAGVTFRFLHDIQIGDGIIYPSKNDRMVNLGIITGNVTHHPDETTQDDALTNRRTVKWKKHIPRTNFSQAALNEIGSAITLFSITNNADEFWAAFQGEKIQPQPDDFETAIAVSEHIEENTDDFVIKILKNSINPTQFEEFSAALLRAMGYKARVTKQTGDGNVDVVAHKDELGFEPPIIKVQCKQTLGAIGRPAVQQLVGTIQVGEHGLFMTLGNYAAPARTLEQTSPNIRLLDGQEIAELIYENYDRLPTEWKIIIPLRKSFLPG